MRKTARPLFVVSWSPPAPGEDERTYLLQIGQTVTVTLRSGSQDRQWYESAEVHFTREEMLELADQLQHVARK